MVLGIVFFLATLFGPRPWEKTQVTIHDQSCGSFSLVLEEKRRINRLEGSGVSYALDYVASDTTKSVDYLGGNLLGGVDPTPVHTTIPVTSFENPGVGADRDEGTEYRTLYVNPAEFTEAEFEAISLCVREHRESFHAAFRAHLQDAMDSDRDMNIYRNGHGLRIIGTAYADRQDFNRFMSSQMERGVFKNESLGHITIGSSGLVKAQYIGYLGNYFELIPEGNASSLKEYDFKNDEGVFLVEYLRRLALTAREYAP